MGRSSLRVAVAFALLLAATALGVARAGTPDRSLHRDPADTHGPLDLAAAKFIQVGQKLELHIRTRRAWTAADLEAQPGRGLCVRLFSGAPTYPRNRLCVVAASGLDSLEFEHLSQHGRVLAKRPLVARIARPDERTLVATFPPKSASLPIGDFRWSVISSWQGTAGCTPAIPCRDRLPDAGTLDQTILPPRVVGCKPRAPWQRFNGPRDQGRIVALTFDDGPSIYTSSVLAVLRRFHVHATFFLLGGQIPGHEDLVKEELADGNQVGDHSYTHPVLSGGGSFADSQIRRTAAQIKRASGGYYPCVFRPPYGSTSPALVRVARSRGMNTIIWDVDTVDWSRPGAGTIYSRAIRGIHPGSINLMHDGGGDRSQSVAALPRIIRKLKAEGYSFVTLSGLLGLRPVYATS